MTANEPKPFAYSGDHHREYFDALVGNREGLTLLRDQIDRALQEGEAGIECEDIEWQKVVRLDSEPVYEKEPFTFGTGLVGAGCLLAIATVLVLLVLGVDKLIDLLR